MPGRKPGHFGKEEGGQKKSVRLTAQERRDFELIVFMGTRLRGSAGTVIERSCPARRVNARFGRQRTALLRGCSRRTGGHVGSHIMAFFFAGGRANW